MGKESRRKKSRSRRSSVKATPDQVLQFGGLTIAQFGNVVQLANNSTPEEHAALMERVRIKHPETKKELETAILDLQKVISRYDPLELMHRASYELMMILIARKPQYQHSYDEAFGLPAAEYLQYLIARTKFDIPPIVFSDEEWSGIWKEVLRVLTLTQTYLMTRPEPNPPSEIDRLRFFIDGQRLGVRIKRYGCYFEDHLRTSLSPYDQWITTAYGVTSEQVVAGLLLIQNYEKTGVRDRYVAMIDEQRKLMTKLAAEGYRVDDGATPAELEKTSVALQSDEFRSLYESVNEKSRLALTSAAFDITDVCALPATLMSILSVRPGEDVLNALTGPSPTYEDLSPLSLSILHRRPFLEIDARFYLTYHSGLEDQVSEIIEGDLLSRFPNQSSAILEKRSDSAETLGFELLASLVKPERTYRNLYYPNPDKPGDLTELDILLIVDDVLILGEVKGGGLSSGARRGAPKEIAAELSDLIIKGQQQSERAERYIRSADEVVLYDETGKTALATLRHGDYRRVFRVVITRENLGWVGAEIAVLSILDPNLSKSYPWHVSIDDLRAIVELFSENELVFVHFLEQRLTAAAQTNLSQHDELDHVALYQKVPYYYFVPPGAEHVSFDASFMADIDAYFANKSSGQPTSLPSQAMPAALKLFIDELRTSRLSGRFEVASLVLSIPEPERTDFSAGIAKLVSAGQQGRQQSVRMPFTRQSTGLTVTFARDQNWEEELRVSAAQMQQSRCANWLVVQMEYSTHVMISRIERLVPGRFSEEDLMAAVEYLEGRVERAIEAKNVGRNDRCPCGSGKKYKRCHGR